MSVRSEHLDILDDYDIACRIRNSIVAIRPNLTEGRNKITLHASHFELTVQLFVELIE